MLCHDPAGWKHHKVCHRHARSSRRACEDCEDGWIGMVESYRVHRAEHVQIVFVRAVVAMPCCDIERRVILHNSSVVSIAYPDYSVHTEDADIAEYNPFLVYLE